MERMNWDGMIEKQPILTKILTNSIQNNRISHAYLFQGSRGTGKQEMAALLAKTVFCKQRQDINPCQTCSDCKRIDSGNHPDLHRIEPDGASIKKDQILHLQKEFTYSGLESNRKVYIIKDAERMTTNASNRLLKFLEEPSRDTVAILLTENSHAILDTIRSRCQVMSFKPLVEQGVEKELIHQGVQESSAKILAMLTSNITEAIDKSKDEEFAQTRKLVVQLNEMLRQNPGDVPVFIHTLWMPHFKEKKSLQEGLDLLLLWFRDVMHIHLDVKEKIVHTPHIDKLEAASTHWSLLQTTKVLEKIMAAKRKLEQNVQPQLVMEQLTLQMQR